MSEAKRFASLSPSLLARKGAARPAMRPQIQPMHQYHEATARSLDTDLGWNDMGHEADADVGETAHAGGGDVVSINQAASLPEVVRQQSEIAARLGGVESVSHSRSRRSALSDGRRAAFTLRLDAERHLKLRLACAVANRSAQQLVTEALDNLLCALPDVADLAAQVRKSR